MLRLFFVLIIMAHFGAGLLSAQTSAGMERVNGLSFVAPPDSFSKDPFIEIKAHDANFISVIPYGFSRLGITRVWFDVDGQWWGETMAGARSTIQEAHRNGLSVMLKPQVYVPGSWVGAVDFDNEEDWKTWEEEYAKFILSMAQMADQEGVAIFCLGTEVKTSVQKRTQFWRSLIHRVKEVYCGEVTYSANWDNYDRIQFWDDLDYIGISAYFPLTASKTPSTEELIAEWLPIKRKLNAYCIKWRKPLLFTEYGYLSVDGAAGKTWELEERVWNLEVNEEAQYNALEALYATFYPMPSWAGGFLWKWFPNGQGHEGYVNKDYTPQNKKAASLVKTWFGK